MRLIITCIFVIALLPSCNNSPNVKSDIGSNDVIFITWNKSTLRSLKDRILIASSTDEKELSRNRIDTRKAYLQITNEDQANKSSIRYKFLDKLSQIQPNQKNFFIVEADQSGETSEKRSYVVNIHERKVVHVYDFVSGKWVEHSVTQDFDFTISKNLNDYRVDYLSGFNSNDVIITLFENGKVVSSQHFIPTTMIKKDGIEKLLKLQ
jgi:hypothetical protein